ncbi:hypothetical protein BKA56DRAFT_278375 [Ilyonectria sp. MPI-CAGE-AT-0026]|nr:hypothetical protein BKA56DRAFT_278375 [Ilyonectria sp. MPI-CAGE-AT-0026]
MVHRVTGTSALRLRVKLSPTHFCISYKQYEQRCDKCHKHKGFLFTMHIRV